MEDFNEWEFTEDPEVKKYFIKFNSEIYFQFHYSILEFMED